MNGAFSIRPSNFSLNTKSQGFSPMYSSKGFIVLHFTFRFIYDIFPLIFAQGVRFRCVIFGHFFSYFFYLYISMYSYFTTHLVFI